MEDLLKARIEDACVRSQRENKPCFLGFLNTEQAALAQALLKSEDTFFELFGGFEGAERTFLCVCPYEIEHSAYPICALTLKYRKVDKLTHRDFLGAVLSLGISRESVGDILVGEGETVIFVTKSTEPFVKTQLDRVARCAVAVSEGYNLPLPEISQKVLCTDTVASLRLDAVVSAVCGLSRSAAAQILADGRVSINSLLCQKAEKKVCDGDKITVRGKGRFEIADTSLLSKKGRIILKYNKYL